MACLRRWIFCLLCLLALPALADVPVPPLKARVTDLTQTLTGEQQAELERTLAAFESKKGSQIAVLIVPSTEPETIEQYGIRVAEQWKLGRKGIDDGALLLVAKNDRALRIEVGYGLEGVMPDAVAKRIVSDVIVPYFKQGDFYGGIRAGVDRMIRTVEGEPLPPPRQARGARQEGGGFENGLIVAFLVAVFAGGLLRMMFGRFFGAIATGAVTAGIAAFLVPMLLAVVIGAVSFVFALIGGRPGGYVGGRGWGGGFGSGGGFGGSGGFGGGGGGFGGGGASGRW